MRLKELLIQYELQNDLNHTAMAQKIGVSTSTYYRWINEESTELKKTTLKKIAQVLDCDIEKVLNDDGECVKPILGFAKAGYDLFAEQQIEGYVEVNASDAKKGDYFLRIQGDSMEGSHIYDGDLVYVQKCDVVEDGKFAVVLIGEEATVKKVRYKKNLMILEASNPKYEPKYFTPQEIEEIPVRILGRVRFVRTDFD